MKKIKVLLPVIFIILFSTQNNFSQDSIAVKIYDNLLHKYVVNGLVDYENLTKDKSLEKYIETISKFDPTTLTNKNDKLAFWINAYNAYTLKVILDSYPISSINDLHFGGRIIGHILKTTVWDKEFVIINNKKITLNHIEHDIIRPKFKDPRIHFALVCGAMSCPPLRNEAYTGNKLDAQLNDQGKSFFANQFHNSFDEKNHVVHLSKILDWYGDDFGDSNAQILSRIKSFLPERIAESINDNIIKWQIDFKSYDWDLNKIK